MNKVSGQNSRNDFRQELIDRFFNPQSYFLYSFINELKTQENTLKHPSHVAIVGLLIDEIINAQDKIGLLEELSQINGFKEFYSFLSEKVNFLCTVQLTTPQMMETIRALSSKMVQTLCHMVEDEQAYRRLTERLGVDLEIDSKEQTAKSEIEATASNEPLEESVELGQEAPEEQTEQGQAKQTGRDPRDFFYSDVHQKLKDIEHLLKSNKEKWNLKALQKLKDDFQDLRDWSMIQGDERIEAISHKVLDMLSLLQSRDVSKWNKVLPVIQECVTFIDNLSDSKKEGRTIQAVIEQIQQVHKELQDSSTGPEIAATEVGQMPVVEELETPAEAESILDEIDQSFEEEETEKVSCTESEPEAESLILPGEDDRNLLEAIELWANEDSNSVVVEQNDAEPIDQKVLEDSSVDAQAFEKFIKELEAEPDETLEPSGEQDLKAEDRNGGHGSDLIEEAEMYFTFAKKALIELKQDMTNRRAYEDVELACYSIKILANKLGYELIGKVVGAMEGIMKSVLAGEIELKESHVVMMADILGRIEEMGRGNRFQSAKLKGWVNKVLDSLEQISFSISGKETSGQTGDFSLNQQQIEEDPLEFLMIDDHKKYLKQVLKQ